MKRPERFPPDDPREWINRARSNLALAKNRVNEARQAAEFCPRHSAGQGQAQAQFHLGLM